MATVQYLGQVLLFRCESSQPGEQKSVQMAATGLQQQCLQHCQAHAHQDTRENQLLLGCIACQMLEACFMLAYC